MQDRDQVVAVSEREITQTFQTPKQAGPRSHSAFALTTSDRVYLPP
jgi:hypothetical protein